MRIPRSVADVERFVKRQRVPLITFHKGERKEDIVLPFWRQAKGRERVLVVGKAIQEILTEQKLAL